MSGTCMETNTRGTNALSVLAAGGTRRPDESEVMALAAAEEIGKQGADFSPDWRCIGLAVRNCSSVEARRILGAALLGTKNPEFVAGMLVYCGDAGLPAQKVLPGDVFGEAASFLAKSGNPCSLVILDRPERIFSTSATAAFGMSLFEHAVADVSLRNSGSEVLGRLVSRFALEDDDAPPVGKPVFIPDEAMMTRIFKGILDGMEGLGTGKSGFAAACRRFLDEANGAAHAKDVFPEVRIFCSGGVCVPENIAYERAVEFSSTSIV